MTNSYYNPSGNPGTGASGLSAVIRAEFSAIAAGFAALPTVTIPGPPVLTGFDGSAVIVNDLGTALTLTAGALALAGDLTTTGAFNTTFAAVADVTLTLPAVNAALATLGANIFTASQLIAVASGFVVTTIQSGASNYMGISANDGGQPAVIFDSASALTFATITSPAGAGFTPVATLSSAGVFTVGALAATNTGVGLAVTNNVTIGGTILLTGTPASSNGLASGTVFKNGDFLCVAP